MNVSVYIVVPILMVFTVISAILSARKERDDINAGKYIDHEGLLVGRIVLLCSAIIAAVCFSELRWGLLALIPALWATFTITHRLSLNYSRGFPPNYISVTNAYDRFFLFMVPNRPNVTRDQLSEDYHNAHYLHSIRYTAWIHKAGGMAYFVEVAVLIISLLVLL